MKTLALAFLLSVAALAVQQNKSNKGHGHGGGNPPPPPPVTCNSGSAISMSPSAWCVADSFMTTNPTPVGTGWFFSFPPAPNLAVEIVTVVSTAFAQNQSMTINFRLTGNNVVFTANTVGGTCPGSPNADFWLYMEHANNTNDTLTWRWWAHPEYVIPDGTYDSPFSFSIPLQPQFWSDVNGQYGNTDSTTLAGYADTLANVGVVGFTIGSGCFAGHGTLLTSGSASMEVDGLSVQ